MSGPKEKWQCPYCERHATIGSDDILAGAVHIDTAAEANRYFAYKFVTCPNSECQQLSAEAWMLKGVGERGGKVELTRARQQRWQLLPRGKARVFPDYVPQAIRNDYTEACLIVSDSPKASATLARRCLQGIIRDVWNITKPRLKDEIDALKDKVEPLTWSAIDAVRSVGNIGAHMERDVNLIVDVEPDEAEKLIGLVETLIGDWYVARHEREKALSEVIELAKRKADEQKGPPPTP